MAKIRITGYNELITVPQDIAKRLEKLWMDESVKRDTKLSQGRYRFTKGDIKAIFLEDEGLQGTTQHEEALKKFFDWRDKHVKQPASVKAKESWAHFVLFYWGLYHEKPSEELRPKFEQDAIAYYEAHPERARASPLLFYAVLGMSKENAKPMDLTALRIIEAVERNELNVIDKNVTYQNYRTKQDTTEAEALLKVEQDNIDFFGDDKGTTATEVTEDKDVEARKPIDYAF